MSSVLRQSCADHYTYESCHIAVLCWPCHVSTLAHVHTWSSYDLPVLIHMSVPHDLLLVICIWMLWSTPCPMHMTVPYDLLLTICIWIYFYNLPLSLYIYDCAIWLVIDLRLICPCRCPVYMTVPSDLLLPIAIWMIYLCSYVWIDSPPAVHAYLCFHDHIYELVPLLLSMLIRIWFHDYIYTDCFLYCCPCLSSYIHNF